MLILISDAFDSSLEGKLAKFGEVTTDKDRLSALPEIEAFYGVLLDEAKGVVRGELVTAIELGDAKQEEVKKQLADQLGKELVLDFSADGDILGGVVLKVGDKILDASLKAQLNAMKEQIKRGE